MTNAFPTDVGSISNQAGENDAKTMNEEKPVVHEEEDDSDYDGPYDFEVEDEDDGTNDDDAVEEFEKI